MKQSVTAILSVALSVPLTFAGTQPAADNDEECRGYIRILGNTNLNSFELQYSFGTDPFQAPLSTGGPAPGTGRLKIPVEKFQGNSPAMERDFYALLKSDRYPEIILEFSGINHTDRLAGKVDYGRSNVGRSNVGVSITMAGVTRKYDVICEMLSDPDGKVCLRGEKAILISDFRLDPPERLFGTVRVEDYINVDFSVNFTTSRQAYLTTGE